MRRTGRIRRIVPTALLAACLTIPAAFLGGCDTDDPGLSATSEGAFPGRLAILGGTADARRLLAYDSEGRGSTIELPAPDVTWMSADRNGAMAVTRADGTILVAAPGPADWRPVDLGGALQRMDGQPLMATWSPDGRLGALVADVERAALVGVLVVDPSTDGTLVLPLVTGVEGSAPAWLDAVLVAVPARDLERPVITVVDVDGGPARDAASPARAIVASPDGSTLALLTADAAEVEVWRAGPWLDAWRTGGSPDPAARLAVLRPPAGLVRPTALALDASGDRLAVAWGRPDGISATVTVHAETAGWDQVARLATEPTEAVPALAFLP